MSDRPSFLALVVLWLTNPSHWNGADGIPTRLVEWTQLHVHSRIAFLLGLNVFLLLVGTVMDIFSAIVVVVPLILPLAEFYGINVVHLGITFVANLELGFLHPPLGLNLLLASVRFKKPVLEVTWATLPMFGILAFGSRSHGASSGVLACSVSHRVWPSVPQAR